MTSRRRRHRRRTRHHPVRRRRRIVAYSLLVLAGLVAVFAGLVARDALAVRRDLQAGREPITAVRSALAEGDIDAAEEGLADAQRTIDRAERRSGRMLWQIAEGVPGFGRSLAVVEGVVHVADAAVGVGRQVMERSGSLLGDDGSLEVQVADGRVDLRSLRVTAESVGGIDLDRLRRARERLSSMAGDGLVAQVREGRRDALALSEQVLSSVERASRLLDALPSFLGEDGPRRYFLAMQNNAELRGTGGFMGVFGIVTVDDGEFTLEETRHISTLTGGQEGSGDLPPVSGHDAFVQRYASVNAAGFFPNVNVDPDLPTVGPVMVDLYGQSVGSSVDGVIAIDPIGLSRIMQPIGAVDVADDLLPSEGEVPDPVPPDRIPEVAMIHAVQTFGNEPVGGERHDYILGLAEAAFQRFFAGGWEGIAVGRELAAAAQGRHLQLFSTDTGEQEAFESLGLAGRMDTPERTDLLAVTANNAGANKQDVHVGHSVFGEIRFEDAGEGWRRESTVAVELTNGLPASGMDETILGSAPTSTGRQQGYNRFDGFNRTWFTVWAPASSDVVAARDGDGRELLVGVGELHGEQAVDHFLETPAGETNRFEVDLTGPVEMVRSGDDLLYRVRMWRQAKAIPDRVDLTVHAPAGMRVVGASVVGGGDGAGMGPFGEAGPAVTVDTFSQEATITGDVTADLDIEVRFAPPREPWWDRVRAWLNEPAF